MARQESDREDLIREATALEPRIELRIPGEADNLVAGFRGNGFLSLYYGADPVYQFDDEGRLRRAFFDGDLYRTQGDTLARLTRHRTPTATELLRHDLDESELAQFAVLMRARLIQLAEALQQQPAVVAQVPEHAQVFPELKTHVDQVLESSQLLAPRIPGKR